MQEINLYDLLKFYAKKWWIIVTLTVIGVVSGFIFNEYIQVPMYKSGATLLLIRSEDKMSVQDVTIINNYKELLKSRRVLEPVSKKLNLNQSYDELVSSIETVNDKDTEVIKMSVSTSNPKTSKSIVDGIVGSFKKQVKELYVIDNVQVVDNAYLSSDPYNVHKEMTIALSATAGFITSIIALFFVYDFKMNNKGKLDTKEPKVKKIKVKKIKKLSAVSRSLVAMISKQIKASSLKRQAAKLVRAKKAKLVKAEKAKKAELAKIKKNEKAELAKQEKANKLELSKVEKAKKVKQAKAKKAKKSKANRALIYARFQNLKTKLTKVISDWLTIATKTIKSNLNKKSKVKAKPVKKA